jgi:hypothetical protein
MFCLSSKCKLMIVIPLTCICCVAALTFCKGSANPGSPRECGHPAGLETGTFFINCFRHRTLRNCAGNPSPAGGAVPGIVSLFKDWAFSPRL